MKNRENERVLLGVWATSGRQCLRRAPPRPWANSASIMPTVTGRTHAYARFSTANAPAGEANQYLLSRGAAGGRAEGVEKRRVYKETE